MCTGITLMAGDGSAIYGRTMEWGSFDLNSRLVIVPPGAKFTGSTPNPKQPGIQWTTKLGFVAIDAVEKDIFADGMNMAGLACGLFYHPGMASYEPYDSTKADRVLAGSELSSFILGQFTSVKQVRSALKGIHVVSVFEPAINMPAPVHYLVVEPSGEAIVIEFLDNKTRVFDAPLRVITNSPEYPWHMTNLRNYVNLSPVSLPSGEIGGLNFSPLGGGSGMIGLPGDFTPPSRMVRAVAFSQTARPTSNAEETVYEHFRILDNFNVPLGAAEGSDDSGHSTKGLRSATLWTTAADTRNRVYYYHTQHNRRVRKVAVGDIDFGLLDGKILRMPLDKEKTQDIEDVTPRR